MHAVDIIFLGLTVVVAYRLYNILGQKNGQDEIKSSLKKTRSPEISVDVPINQENKNSDEKSPLITALKQIEHADKTFTQERFLEGAEKAFEMILSAFMKGDKKALQDLVSPKILKQFSDVIDQREKNKTRAELSFLRVMSVNIQDITIKNNTATIKVLFQSEQTQLLKNEKNEILEGDSDHIEQIDELWTFERPLHSNTPNWFLTGTAAS